MTVNLGTVRPGSTLVIPFSTYSSDDPSKSIVVTELDVGAISVYKDGGTTKRASTTGEGVDIDVDSIVGTHWITIDLSSNAAAGFYAAGSRYVVILNGLVIDAATAMSNAVATFDIGFPDALINTTIASATSDTQFILTTGPAEADVLIGCPIVIQAVAAALGIGIQIGYITDYIVTTKEVFIAADPGGGTVTAADHVGIMMPANVRAVGGTLQTPLNIDDILTDTAQIGTAGAGLSNINLPNQTMDITGALSGSVGSVTGAVGSVAGNVDGNVTGSVGSNLELGPAEVNTQADLALTDIHLDHLMAADAADIPVDGSVIAQIVSATEDWSTFASADDSLQAVGDKVTTVDTVVDAIKTETDKLDSAHAEPTGVPAANETPLDKIATLFMMARNKVTVTTSKKTYFGDDDAAEFEKDLSDDATTYTETETNAI